MTRLLLYVHFNKYNKISQYVDYQLEQLRPLFSKILFISNSQLELEDIDDLKTKNLIDDFIQRDNIGFDFAAWRDGLNTIGYDNLSDYDSITMMNDTCFGPLWDMTSLYQKYEQDDTVDFWGMTNHRQTKQFAEHLQSYFMVFKRSVLSSFAFLEFWKNVQDFTVVQDVIRCYETQVTTNLLSAGFSYQSVFDTTTADDSRMPHADFSYYNPRVILHEKVPFLKVKAVDANQHIMPYLLDEIEQKSDYPLEMLISHMSDIYYPDSKYLLGRKLLKDHNSVDLEQKKIAVHLHVFYVDLLGEFLTAFQSFHFSYDLFITTDQEKKREEISALLDSLKLSGKIVVTGNIGRDVLPMLKLKKELKKYDYIGHFHTKKSKEADFLAGESWRRELIDMLIRPANTILANFENQANLGLVIADIPTFFRYNKIVDARNEHLIAPKMNDLWGRMELNKNIDFNSLDTFVMSYGTFVWFRYDALAPLFDLDLTEEDIPSEPLPQNSILHAIERLLVYIAWDQHYDFKISENPIFMTAFIDNKLLNERGNFAPQGYADFTYMGGIKGALKYIIIGPTMAIKYICKRIYMKVGDRYGLK